MVNISQIVIWGYAPNERIHTHHYIHYGFYKAFNYLNYKTYWVNEDTGYDYKYNIKPPIIENTLFIVEHQKQNNLPIRNDCYYILHNVYWDKEKSWLKFSGWKYSGFKEIAEQGRVINLQVNRRDYYTPDKKIIDNNNFFYSDIETYRLFISWATDLLPDEIKNNEYIISKIIKERRDEVYFIGTDVAEWKKWKSICEANNINVNITGGFKEVVSYENNKKLIQLSWCAPAIQRKLQVDTGYIPCRIFKNISYGAMGITNNKYVNELFNNKLIYAEDLETLFNKVNEWKKLDNIIKEKKILELMEIVKNEHTYINRIETILNYFNEIEMEL